MVTYGYRGWTLEVLSRRLPVGLLVMQELRVITEIVGWAYWCRDCLSSQTSIGSNPTMGEQLIQGDT